MTTVTASQAIPAGWAAGTWMIDRGAHHGGLRGPAPDEPGPRNLQRGQRADRHRPGNQYRLRSTGRGRSRHQQLGMTFVIASCRHRIYPPCQLKERLLVSRSCAGQRTAMYEATCMPQMSTSVSWEAWDEMTRSVHTMDQENMSASLIVGVPAARVFTMLADQTTHQAIDGTGWVTKAVDRAPLAEVGQIFWMHMYHPGHPDGRYMTANKVQMLDPPHAIAWLTGHDPKGDGHLEFGGWFWRYDLTPLGTSRAVIRLSYDWSAVPQRIREYLHFPPSGPEHLTNSLHRLADLVAPTSQACTPGGQVPSTQS
jgi:hypothetical protein